MSKTIVGKVGMTLKGDYLNTTQYKKLDVVTFEGSSYVCIKDCQGIAVTNTNFWQLIAQHGEFTEQQLEDFKDAVVEDSKDEMDTYTNTKKTELDTYVEDYEDDLKSSLDNYETEKEEELNGVTNDNISAINRNTENKITEFNTNATDKTTEYNTNATSKVNEYNTNANNKIAEYDAHVEELQEQIDELKETVDSELESNVVEGTSIDVSDSAKGTYSINVKANTHQNRLTGKNLLPNISESSTIQGITYTLNEDKSITVDGTATAQSNKYIVGSGGIYEDLNLPAGDYVLSGLNQSNDATMRLYCVKKDINGVITTNSFATGSLKITVNEGDTFRIFIRVLEEQTVNNITIYPQLEAGTIATEYEEYCGGQASPNPNYPQKINVVTGDNVIKHVGKNLVNVYEYEKGGIGEDGSLNTNAYNARGTKLIHATPNTEYTISWNLGSAVRIIEYNKNGEFIKRNLGASDGKPLTITTTENTYFIKWNVYFGRGYTFEELLASNLMLEEGNTVSSYEAYDEKEYKLDLWEDNIDKDNYSIINCLINKSSNSIQESSHARTLYIPIQTNKTYSVRKTAGARFVVATTTEVPVAETACNQVISDNTATRIIINTNKNDNYLCVYFYLDSADTLTEQELLNSIQIQKAMELCKIGAHEDFLFKNVKEDENYNAELEEGSWYKYGAIKKYDIDNDLTANSISDNSVNVVTSTLDIVANLNGGDLSNIALCNKLTSRVINYMGMNGTTSESKIRLQVSKTLATTYQQAYTLLQGAIIYFGAKNPTYTKITDTTLISQLEALRKAKWFKGVNHWWTETENLEPILKTAYKQSNNLRIQALEQAVVALGGV